MSSLGHPVVGDALYGAPGELRSQSNKRRSAGMPATVKLDRNFLHSAVLEFAHPRTKESLKFSRPLPKELKNLLDSLENARQEGPRPTCVRQSLCVETRLAAAAPHGAPPSGDVASRVSTEIGAVQRGAPVYN